MNAAAPKTYISKRMMEDYRQKRMSKKQEAMHPKVKKIFQEDAEEMKSESSAAIMQQPSMQAA